MFQVILIENKEESLVRAQARSCDLGLTNIRFIQANLDYFTGPFHIGVCSTGIDQNFLFLEPTGGFHISVCMFGT